MDLIAYGYQSDAWPLQPPKRVACGEGCSARRSVWSSPLHRSTLSGGTSNAQQAPHQEHTHADRGSGHREAGTRHFGQPRHPGRPPGGGTRAAHHRLRAPRHHRPDRHQRPEAARVPRRGPLAATRRVHRHLHGQGPPGLRRGPVAVPHLGGCRGTKRRTIEIVADRFQALSSRRPAEAAGSRSPSGRGPQWPRPNRPLCPSQSVTTGSQVTPSELVGVDRYRGPEYVR